MKKISLLIAIAGLCVTGLIPLVSSYASEQEYVNNSMFTQKETIQEYSFDTDTSSVLNKWFVQMPNNYGYGWNATQIGNGKAVISSNDGNISTIQSNNGDQTSRRSPTLKQNVQVSPNKKYVLNIEIEKFSGDSSYLVINNENLSSEVNGFINGPAVNTPVYNYSYNREVMSDDSGVIPISIYMQHAADKWVFSWAPFTIIVDKVSIVDITDPSSDSSSESSSNSSSESSSDSSTQTTSESGSETSSQSDTETTNTEMDSGSTNHSSVDSTTNSLFQSNTDPSSEVSSKAEKKKQIVAITSSSSSSSNKGKRTFPKTGEKSNESLAVIGGTIIISLGGYVYFRKMR